MFSKFYTKVQFSVYFHISLYKYIFEAIHLHIYFILKFIKTKVKSLYRNYQTCQLENLKIEI